MEKRMDLSAGSVTGLHHLAIRASDFDRTVKFYTDGLGCRAATSWGQAPGRAVMLDTGNGSCVEIFEGGQPGPKPEGALLHFAFSTDDCDASYRRALAAGAKGTVEPKDVTVSAKPQPFSVRLAFCTGLDGETIEFFQKAG
ncbi:MAG: VOC family protein [bacterium]